MRFSRWVLTVLLVITVVTHAQDSLPSDRELIQQLVRQVKELQEKVQALEVRKPSASGDPAGGPAPLAVVSPPSETADGGTAPLQSILQQLHENHGIQWKGFGEVNYKVLDQRTPELGSFGFVPGSHGNFYTADFDLLLTASISDKASVLSEITFGEGDAQEFGVDLERVLLKYDYSDHLKLSFGRYHTAVGYYNTQFHSGSWLQTTADRPLIMEFANDGGPLPTQAIGVSATGEIPSGKLNLNYIAEYGSSDTIRPELNGLRSDDENNGNHINVGLFVRPEAIPGLQVGGSLYHDRISDFVRGPSVRLGQTIANAHIVYAHRKIEFLNEGFLIRPCL